MCQRLVKNRNAVKAVFKKLRNIFECYKEIHKDKPRIVDMENHRLSSDKIRVVGRSSRKSDNEVMSYFVSMPIESE